MQLRRFNRYNAEIPQPRNAPIVAPVMAPAIAASPLMEELAIPPTVDSPSGPFRSWQDAIRGRAEWVNAGTLGTPFMEEELFSTPVQGLLGDLPRFDPRGRVPIPPPLTTTEVLNAQERLGGLLGTGWGERTVTGRATHRIQAAQTVTAADFDLTQRTAEMAAESIGLGRDELDSFLHAIPPDMEHQAPIDRAFMNTVRATEHRTPVDIAGMTMARDLLAETPGERPRMGIAAQHADRPAQAQNTLTGRLPTLGRAIQVGDLGDSVGIAERLRATEYPEEDAWVYRMSKRSGLEEMPSIVRNLMEGRPLPDMAPDTVRLVIHALFHEVTEHRAYAKSAAGKARRWEEAVQNTGREVVPLLRSLITTICTKRNLDLPDFVRRMDDEGILGSVVGFRNIIADATRFISSRLEADINAHQRREMYIKTLEEQHQKLSAALADAIPPARRTP